MKEGYISKDKRKKILMLSDDIRTHSGVGGMARNIILNSAHYFNWVNFSDFSNFCLYFLLICWFFINAAGRCKTWFYLFQRLFLIFHEHKLLFYIASSS